MSWHFLTININPEATMAEIKGFSPIPSSIPDENVDNSSIELDPSGAQWSGPENQLSPEPDDQKVGLDKEGKI
jgi:hypothetical protein